MWPQTTYLICTTPRSGSNLLSDILIGTGLAGRPREYFLQASLKKFFEEFHSSTYFDYVNSILEETTTANRVFGGKVMIYSFGHLIDQIRQFPTYQDRSLSASEMLADLFPNLHYIYLTRRNKVRQAISTIWAFKTGIWHTYDQAEKPAAEIPFKPEDVAHLVHVFALQEASWQEFFSQNGITPLTLVYEDFSQNLAQAARQVLAYLELPAPPDWDLNKIKIGVKLADTQSDQLTEQYLEYCKPLWDPVNAKMPPLGETQNVPDQLEQQISSQSLSKSNFLVPPLFSNTSESQLPELLNQAHQMQQKLRQEPVIGSLTPVKRLIYALNNSTFSRQFNLNELFIKLFDLLHDDLAVTRSKSQQELASLQQQLQQLAARVETLNNLDQPTTRSVDSGPGTGTGADNSDPR